MCTPKCWSGRKICKRSEFNSPKMCWPIIWNRFLRFVPYSCPPNGFRRFEIDQNQLNFIRTYMYNCNNNNWHLDFSDNWQSSDAFIANPHKSGEQSFKWWIIHDNGWMQWSWSMRDGTKDRAAVNVFNSFYRSLQWLLVTANKVIEFNSGLLAIGTF